MVEQLPKGALSTDHEEKKSGSQKMVDKQNTGEDLGEGHEKKKNGIF